MEEQSRKRPYFRPSTASQRRRMFEVWEETKDKKQACEEVKLGLSTFYYWKKRFLEEGYKGIEKERSHAPHNPKRTPEWIVEKVMEMKKTHPEWGYQRISDELMKRNNWEPLVSMSTVRHILKDKGLDRLGKEKKVEKKEKIKVRHAEKPGQTVNIDLCFVPTEHQPVEEIPAVSGSSGKLRVSKTKSEKEKEERQWPGQIFNDPELSYEQTMNGYMRAREEKENKPKSKKKPQSKEIKARRKELLEEEKTLAEERRKVREERKKEDERWRNVEKSIDSIEEEGMRDVMGQKFRAKRKAEIQPRKEEDQRWKEERDRISRELYNLPIIKAFVAILVIVDNCTRQCLVGLPMYVAGKHVTAEMVVDSLAVLLPESLQYLIADRGVHFKAEELLKLADLYDFNRVLLAPHRPQSNGIAERYVQTLKDHLTSYSWASPAELENILREAVPFYNDRPHQGAELKGLSPNEYSRRVNIAIQKTG